MFVYNQQLSNKKKTAHTYTKDKTKPPTSLLAALKIQIHTKPIHLGKVSTLVHKTAKMKTEQHTQTDIVMLSSELFIEIFTEILAVGQMAENSLIG